MDAEFSVEIFDQCVELARSLKPRIKPMTADDGRQFYLMYSCRERMIDGLLPGWTWKAVTFTASDGHSLVVFEPVEIESLVADPRHPVAYAETDYIDG